MTERKEPVVAASAALAEKLKALMDAAGVQGAIEIDRYDGKTILCDQSNVGGLIADIEVNKIRADTLTLMVAATNALPIILAALSRDGGADGWRNVKRDAWNEALIEAAHIARYGCLVPPDGGSPTDAERQMCNQIEAAILALRKPPPAAQKEEGT